MEIDVLQIEIDALEREIQRLNRKPYNVKPRLKPILYTDEEFRRRFRLSKGTVQYLYDLIGADLEATATRTGFTLSGMDKILLTLRYYATASYHITTADFYGVSESTVCKYVPIVSDKIASLRARFIQMPTTDAEIEKNKLDFFQVAGMPAIIGAVDGTLVKIQEVGGSLNKTAFFCRKQFYAINTQIICDANAKVLDIVARWPGCIHDQKVFSHSNIFQRFMAGEFIRNQRHSILLGDGGYRAETFLAVPLRATNQMNRASERMYQRAHISSRNVVERYMGQWKKRFPCLWLGMRFRKIQTVLNVIVATAVLHNICKMRGDIEEPTLTREQQIRYEAAVRQEHAFHDEQQARVNQRTRRQPHTISNQLLKDYFENAANEGQQQ